VQGKLARRVRWGGRRNVRSERNVTRCIPTLSLPPVAFTVADVVALYLHRGAFETVLSDEDHKVAWERGTVPSPFLPSPFRTVRAPFSAYGSPFLFSSRDPVSSPSFMDIVVTGLTNDERFASSFGIISEKWGRAAGGSVWMIHIVNEPVSGHCSSLEPNPRQHVPSAQGRRHWP
jgi:hypothetical protein